jgi:hypothetical protein
VPIVRDGAQVVYQVLGAKALITERYDGAAARCAGFDPSGAGRDRAYRQRVAVVHRVLG